MDFLRNGLLSLGLKGCAKGFAAGICAVRSYCDLACGAIGFAIVIVTVLNVALDSLNVLAAAAAIHLLVFHGSISFGFYGINALLRVKIAFTKISFSRIRGFIPFLKGVYLCVRLRNCRSSFVLRRK